MVVGNDSSVTEFILVGFTDLTQLQLPLFLLFFVNHMVTVVGNVSLINLIYLNAHLHTPMYFFIFNLSFIDLCHSLVIRNAFFFCQCSCLKIVAFLLGIFLPLTVNFLLLLLFGNEEFLFKTVIDQHIGMRWWHL